MNLRYFNTQEFACKCGCGIMTFDEDVAKQLDGARHTAGIPFTLLSACRCPEWNGHPKVQGSRTSSHIAIEDGDPVTAVDIWTPDSPTRWRVVAALIDHGFNRIGIANEYVHTDCDANKPPCVMWRYGGRSA